MNFNEVTRREETVYEGKIIRVRRDEVELPNRKNTVREVVEHSGGAAVLVAKEGKIAFVRQFRYPYKRMLLELPAGKLNPGEDPERCAMRELTEETGLISNSLVSMGKLYPSPGYTDEVIHLYMALNAAQGEQNPDEDEFVSVEWLDETTVKAMLRNCEIEDAKTVAALSHYFLFYCEKI